MLSVALVGYTNAGKSSVLRALSGEHEIVVEDRLFATLDTLTREVELGESFRATLEEAREGDVLLHVVDASHPDWEGQMRVVDKVLAELNLADRPTIAVFNKMDAVSDPAAFTARARELYPDAVMVTTMRTDGLDALKAALRSRNRVDRPTVSVRLPLSDGARAASLYRLGEVVSRQETGEGYALTVRLNRWQIDRLKAEGVDVEEAGPAVRQRATG